MNFFTDMIEQFRIYLKYSNYMKNAFIDQLNFLFWHLNFIFWHFIPHFRFSSMPQ